jgi:hypothetical protein
MKSLLILACVGAFMLLSMPAVAENRIDVDLGAGVISHDPYDMLGLHFLAKNCGSCSAVARFVITLEKDLTLIGSLRLLALMPPGVSFTHTFALPIPQCVPAGMYTLCIDASIGSASDRACVSVTLDAENNVIRVEPLAPAAVEAGSWSTIKAMYH